MFTIDQTLSYPSFFQKRLDNFSYFFKRLLPLLLVYFVSFSNSTTAQTTSSFSDACGCGTDKECKFKGDSKVCPGSYNTYCIYKKVKKGYTYRWSVKGDGCYVPAPSECKKSCITIRAKNSCWASYTVKLKIRDKYGKTVSTCKKVVWVGDKEKPKVKPCWIAKCYTSRAAAIEAAIAETRANAWDNCTPKNKLKIKAYTYGDDCNLKIVVKVKDRCGNWRSVTYYTRVDTIPPTFTNCPADTTVQCYSQVPAVDTITATDNCRGKVTVLYNGQTETNPGSNCNNVITRTWTATDACGNPATCTQTITVNDVTPPMITCPLAVTVECYKDIPGHTSGDFYAQGGTASDNCGTVSVTWISDEKVKDDDYDKGDRKKCRKVIKRTYRATDGCGLTADCYQFITVEDTKAPEFYNCPKKNEPIVIKTCDKDAICEEIGKIYATDNCDDDVKYWYKIKELYSDCDKCDYAEDDENGWQEGTLSKDHKFECFKVYLVVIKAKDKCGNVSKCKFKIIVKKGDECNEKNAIVSSRPVNTGKPGLSNQESSTLSVRTAPNPYRDKIRFVIQSKVSGLANLELYNLLGQKVQSVYKGQINAGSSQIIDFDVPPSMRTNLIYRLNIGGQFKTGKVIKE